jgi:TetR/AcrR family transcriptional repressor of nem operon
MTAGVGRPSDARDRLIQATIDLVWLHSYGAVTVDAICDRAGVKKGSFYHFFDSKDDLVIAALEHNWQERRPVLDRLFSPIVPPLDRLRGYFENVYERQKAFHARTGQVLGCLHASIGAECIQGNPRIAQKVQEILGLYLRYYETALREAAAVGEAELDDPRAAARTLFTYMEGTLGQARIQNDLAMVRGLAKTALDFLLPRAVAAPRPARATARRAR